MISTITGEIRHYAYRPSTFKCFGCEPNRKKSKFERKRLFSTSTECADINSQPFRFPVPFSTAMASQSQPLAELGVQSGFLANLAKKHPVFLFFILAYALGWGMVTPRVLSWLGILPFDVPYWWVSASFYAPCIAGLLMQWLTERNLKVCRLYESWPKLLLGIVVGAFLILICNTVIPALLAEKAPFRTLNWRVFFTLTSYRLYYSEFLTPIGEEIGWRGYALPRLQTRFGPVWASVLIGLVWAGFMLPAFTLVRMLGISAILMYAVNLVALSVEMTVAMNLSGFSIIVAVFMHTFASAMTARLLGGLITHGQPRLHSDWILSASNLLVAAFLVLATRGKLCAVSREPVVGGEALPKT